MKTLTDWLSYIESIHHRAIDLSLERIKPIADALGLMSFDVPVITVGGTNGKGSTIALLTSLIESHGLTVAAYTSPHFFQFNERLYLNGEQAPDNFLVEGFEQIQAARAKTPLTFFEFTTLAILWCIKQTQVDVILLEVGLGGRCDAVNIVNADIAILTSIDLDHEAWLGHTRALIAKEKAGIFKKRAIAICGDPNPPAIIAEHAKAQDTTLYQLGQNFYSVNHPAHWEYHFNDICFKALPYSKLVLSNMLCALTALTCLPIDVEHTKVVSALAACAPHARLELLQQGSESYLFDVAHNPQSCDNLACYVRKTFPKKRVLALFSCLEDKNIPTMLEPFKGIVSHCYIAPLTTSRAASVGSMSEALSAIHQDFTAKSSIAGALDQMNEDSQPGDLMLIFGSFFTIVAVKNEIKARHAMKQSKNLQKEAISYW